jgi:hypothetical protein
VSQKEGSILERVREHIIGTTGWVKKEKPIKMTELEYIS